MQSRPWTMLTLVGLGLGCGGWSLASTGMGQPMARLGTPYVAQEGPPPPAAPEASVRQPTLLQPAP
ncbi:MAG: hypothetical protein NZO58_09180, partial [Gemmataceae bacterium]|nr:hypothetical protein [Gemmataceae bacterium]